MDKCNIIQQVFEHQEEERATERKRSQGATSFQKMMKQKKKRSKSNFQQPPSYVNKSCSTIYLQPPSVSSKKNSSSSYEDINNNTYLHKKMPQRGSNMQDEDDTGTDLPIIPREKRRGSMGSIATAATVSSGASFISSSSSSHCQTGSNVYNSIPELFAMKKSNRGGNYYCTADDTSTATTATSSFASTSTFSKSCYDGKEEDNYDDFDVQSSADHHSHSFRRLLSSMSIDSLLILENEEEESSDEFTIYCGRLEKNILSAKKKETFLHQAENDDDETRVCTNTSANTRRKNFLLRRRR